MYEMSGTTFQYSARADQNQDLARKENYLVNLEIFLVLSPKYFIFSFYYGSLRQCLLHKDNAIWDNENVCETYFFFNVMSFYIQIDFPANFVSFSAHLNINVVG